MLVGQKNYIVFTFSCVCVCVRVCVVSFFCLFVYFPVVFLYYILRLHANLLLLICKFLKQNKNLEIKKKELG